MPKLEPIVAKILRMTTTTTKTGHVPPFLERDIADHDRNMVRRAYARYLLTKNWSAEEGAKFKLSMRALLFHLAEVDRRWREVEESAMTTTHRLVHGMNSFMYKWKNRYPEVQAQIDEERELMRAPDEADMTAQKSLTASEHSDQEGAEA